MKYKIGIIGSGNMAHFLGRRLFYSAIPACAIYSKNKQEGKALAQRIDAVWFESLEEMASQCNYLLLCVPDDAIAEVAESIKDYPDVTLIHHSGTQPIAVLEKTHPKCGVLWPVYSIHKKHISKDRNIPIVLTSNHPETSQFLSKLAEELTNIYEFMPEDKKKVLHLMAVYTNNFMTHLAGIAQQIGKDKQVPFGWIKPILEQTVSYFDAADITQLQTGPAARKDESTLNTHRALLEEYPKYWLSIYNLITESIQSHLKSTS